MKKRILNTILLAVSVFLLSPQIQARDTEQEKANNILTLQDCIEITLKNNPRIAASVSSAEAQYNRLSQSKAGFLPQVNASGSYAHGDQKVQSTTGGSVWRGETDSYSSAISASQLIYDFGKTGLSARIQKNTYKSALQDAESIINDTVFQLKEAYIGVLAAAEQKEVFIQSVDQYEQQLKRAKAFYSVGTRPRIDVTTATLNLNNAKLSLIQAENTLQIATQRLFNIMGIYDYAADFKLQKQNAVPAFEITLEEALKKAVNNRPDLASYKLKLETARQNVKLSRTGFTPELTANGSYGWSGDDFPLYDRWSVGAGVSVPLFSGFSTVNKVKESKNNLNTAYHNLNDAQQSALLDVRTSFLNLQEASSRIPVADISRQEALENFNLAVGRYTVGVGNYIEVKDAEVSLSNARLSYISAVFDYNLAIADLKRAMGER